MPTPARIISVMIDRNLRPIASKVYAGQRLSAADGLALLQSRDVWTIGELADRVRRRLHGDVAYYNINRHLNYTNICALSCKFCSFYRKKDDDGAYEFSVQHIAQEARQAAAAGATEIHIVGGLHPWLPFSYYTEMLAAIREAAPKLHIKAFTAVEIVHLARIDKRANDLEGVLADLQAAGLGSLPGGGAEVFDDRVHDEAFKGKIRSDKWLEVHKAAHRLGLCSNATILYGHIESLQDRVQHFCMLRDAQDEAIREGWPGRFQTVIPLPFIPDDSELQHLPGPCGLDDLKMLAVSRLMLDNFAHVKAFWIMQTLALSQLALQFGVDDIDGTVVWYDITKVGGSDTHQEVTVPVLRKAVADAGFAPMERDTLYRRVTRQGAAWSIVQPQPVAT
jgi:aminodeoxyfutalosine synthase